MTRTDERSEQARAEAVREAARYIDLLHPKGLTPKSAVLADLEIAADRMGRGIHANGREREADANPQPTTITRAEFEDAYEARFFQDVSHARKVLAFIRELGIEVEDDDE